MFSSEAQGGPNIALITIICGWIFAIIAFLAVSLMLWTRAKQSHFEIDDYLTVLALATNTAIIVQITWAIVDEGQDKHEAEVPRTAFALVVRVDSFSLWLQMICNLLTQWVVALGEPDSVGFGKYLDPDERYFIYE